MSTSRLTPSGGDAHRQARVALDEVGVEPDRLADHLDHRVARQDLLPDHPQLHLGQALTQAPVNAEAEAGVVARAGAVDDELTRPLDGALVTVAGDVPHGDLLALADGLAAELDVFQGGAAHVGDRALPADDLRHGAFE